MFSKVLILSASVGAGHLRAAEAMEKAFRKDGRAEDVRNVDALQYTNAVFRRLYGQAYLDLVNSSPEILGWLYERFNKPGQNDRVIHALNKLNTQPLVKMLRDYEPDVAVCTHFLPAEIISYLKSKEKLRCPLAMTVTDFDVHAMWLCRNYNHYFVAIEETAVHLTEMGVPADCVTVSGIPIDPVFAEPKDAAAMRKKFGLDGDRTTILLSAGGFGVGPIENLLKSLLKVRHAVQVVAICGRNEELRSRLADLADENPSDTVTVHVVGFTTEMDEYMAASDIILGKPGGLTTSEALARGLVFVIVNPIPGQEERNADHLLEQGVGIRCNNLPCLAYKIDRLLDDEGRFTAMRRNAVRLARPDSAMTIVDRIRTMQA